MKPSTRVCYSIRAMFELAQHDSAQPLTLALIAKRQDISVKYLEQLMTPLCSHGFVRSIRGSRGGYLLARSPGQITLGELFACLDGSVKTVECVKDRDYCRRSARCAARKVWAQVEQAIDGILNSVTLADLVR